MPTNWIGLDAWLNQARTSDLSLLVVVMMVAAALIIVLDIRAIAPRAMSLIRTVVFAIYVGVTCLIFATIALTAGLH